MRAGLLVALALALAACGGGGGARPKLARESLDCAADSAFYALSTTPNLPKVSARGDMRISWNAEPSPRPSGQDGGAAILSGFAAPGTALFDVIVLVDVSLSTRAPSGADLNDNKGRPPKLSDYVRDANSAAKLRRLDPGDSILSAELRAAEELLVRLDPARSRVGVVAFSGASGRNKPDAVVVQSPTNDYQRVRQAIAEIAQDDPIGYTHTAAGVSTALRALTQKATSGPPARGIVLLLTDGEPTLPFGEPDKTNPADVDATLRAGCSARAAGAGIYVLGFGDELAGKAPASEALARVTGGVFRHIDKPKEIADAVSETSFAGVRAVTAMNLSSPSMEAIALGIAPDGAFRGEVDLRTGPNRIRVTAVGADGREARSEKIVEFVPATLSTGSPSPFSSVAQ